jgi:hypothetical protein
MKYTDEQLTPADSVERTRHQAKIARRIAGLAKNKWTGKGSLICKLTGIV